MVFNGQDLTSALSPGMRLRSTRTVAAPTRSTSLNGTTHYYSKTSPSGTAQNDDITAGAWIKLTSYAQGTIIGRTDASSGWELFVNASGQLAMAGYAGGLANQRSLTTYQSIPLNRWVHVSASLDMSGYTTATMKAMIDGVDVPVSLFSGGTNPTSLTVAGNLAVGARGNGSQFFNGKIAQAFVFNGNVSTITQSTLRGYMSQGLSGSETSLISAYSFNNSINDLNTTNANNLTANGSAVATNADSPFGGQADGTVSSTIDYGIIQSVSFSTNTTVVVQVPEGCSIPTSGGVSAVSYATVKAPYGMPDHEKKWEINVNWLGSSSMITPSIAGAWGAFTGTDITAPIGVWRQRTVMILTGSNGVSGNFILQTQWDTAAPTVNKEAQHFERANTATSFLLASHRHHDTFEVTAATVYKLYGVITGGSGAQTAYLEGSQRSFLTLTNAYL